jgi:methionine biosynthesis protein MetW
MNGGQRAHFDEVWRLKQQAAGGLIGLRGNQRAMRALTLLSRGDTLLDIGCGSGSFGEAASDHFREVHGVDIAAEAVRMAGQRGVKARVVDAGSEQLPYPDNTFDAVTALSVLQYVVDVPHVLDECRRVLRPNGQFIVCVPNVRAAWRLWTLAINGRFPRTSRDNVGVDGGTLHYFTSRTMRDLAGRTGFDVARAFGVFCLPRWLEHRADAGPFGWLKREFLSAEIVVDLRPAHPVQASGRTPRTAM